MFTYPKELRRKDIKKISKYLCSEEIKDAYMKYLTNYSFEDFARYCEENSKKSLDELIFSFTDLQLDSFKPNSLPWLSHVMINFMIYFHVNLDYGEYYDAYASVLQMTALSIALAMKFDGVSFEDVAMPPHSAECFREFFEKCPDFSFNLEKDCELAHRSFNQDFGFSPEEYYFKVNAHFESEGYF